MSIDIKTKTMNGRAAIEAQHDWGFDRSQYLNASEAGWCARRIWYSKHQPELGAEQEWGYARRGSHGETYMVESLRAANVPLLYAGDEQESIQDEQLRLSATPDGIIAEDDVWTGLEIKTIDPRTNTSRLPREAHVLQLRIGMALVNEHRKPEGVKFSKGLLVYMDASNFDAILQFEVTADDTVLDRMAKKAKKIFRTANASTMPREGAQRGKAECKLCAFREACNVTLDEASSRRANRGSKLDTAAIRYMEVKDTIDDLKVEHEGIKETIKNELAARQMNKGVVGDIHISLTIAKGRASLDRKAVKAAGIDLSPFETVGAPSERLTLKRVT